MHFLLHYLAVHFLFMARVLLNFQVHLHGTLPINGAVIASNHQSAIDGILILALVPNTVFVFRKSLFISHFLINSEMIPVGGATNWLNRSKQTPYNKNICIFPEGGRYESTEDIKYRSGVVVIARNTFRKIYPVAMNTGTIWGRYLLLPKLSAINNMIHVSFLPAMTCNGDLDILERSIKTAVCQIENGNTMHKQI